MARDGFKIFDSDMHVFEPHDLYLKHMDPKWGDRVPRGEPRKRHGQIKFTYGDGTPVRTSGLSARPNVTPGEDKVAHRYSKPLGQGLRCCIPGGGHGRGGAGRGGAVPNVPAPLR